MGGCGFRVGSHCAWVGCLFAVLRRTQDGILCVNPGFKKVRFGQAALIENIFYFGGEIFDYGELEIRAGIS